MSQSRYSIVQLAELAGVNRRTIRYYVQRNLLPPPFGSGRGSYYDESHLERLLEIRDLQLKGVPLSEIDAPPPPSPTPVLFPTEVWTRIHISKGVELHLCNQELTAKQLDTIKRTLSLLLPTQKESNHD